MTSLVPRATIKVAMEKGPNDTTSSGDFTDLSSRFVKASWKRGRTSPLDDFRAGSLSVELDNSDGLLDPMNSAALNYAAGGKGLPLCPVQFSLTWGGTTSRRFTGFLGRDCWVGGYNPRGTASTVVLNAIDALDFSPQLPGYLWGMLIRQLGSVDLDKTYWHLPMDHDFPVLADGSQIRNVSGSGGTAEFSSPLALLGKPASSLTTTFAGAPYMTLPEDAYITSAAADVMPDGDETGLTVFLLWRPDGTTLTGGDVSEVARMEFPGGGNVRWKVQVEDDGEAHVYTYDSGGTLIDSDSIAGAGRWDTNANFHAVVIRFTSGSTMKVWFGGYSVTLTAAASVYESDLIVGGSPTTNTYVDEVTVIRRSLTDDEVAGINLASGVGRAWFGFSHADTLGAYFEAAGRNATSDDVTNWHVPPADEAEYGYMGVGASNGLATTLAEAARVVAGPLGAVWATRDGNLRVRTIDALTDATWAANYATVSASFTDEDATLTPPEYRHAGPKFLGPQVDGIINEARASFSYMLTPLDVNTVQQMTITARDDASIARYGKHGNFEVTTDWHGWERAGIVANEIIDRYSEPRVEIESLALDATGDDDLTDWLAHTCELELAVEVTFNPKGRAAETITDLNIQGEDVELTNTTFTATLNVAKS